MAYPDQALGMRMECAPDADLTADPSTYTWQEITPDLHMPAPIGHQRGAEDEQTESNTESSFTLKNPRGRYTTDNPLSDLWPKFGLNLPVRYSTNTGDGAGWHQEWIQYLSEAKDRWPAGNPNLCVADVTCAGLFRRMGRWDKLESPLRRSISGVAAGDYVPYAYWHLEDGTDATQAAAATPGVGAGVVAGDVDFAASDDLLGSKPLPEFAAGASITMLVPTYTTTDQWAIQVLAKIESAPASATTLIEMYTNGEGTNSKYRIALIPGSPDGIGLYYTDKTTGVETFLGQQDLDGADPSANPTEDDFYGSWRMYKLGESLVAGNLTSWLSLTNEDGGGGAAGIGGFGGATSTLKSVVLRGETGTAGIAFGHTAVFVDPALSIGPTLGDNAAAMGGWAGEEAADRIVRLSREARLPYNVTATRSEPMGPQLHDTLLANFRDCEATDHGMLDDSQGVVGYRALSELYNQDPVLVIDAAYRNELFMPFDPVTDDQKRRNQVTARRPNGSEATVENLDDIDGVPGIQRGVGRYPADIDVNTETDTVLALHASWIANVIGAWPGKRYPAISIDLRRAVHLIGASRNLRLGDRVLVKNPPRQHSRSDIDVIFTGWSKINQGRRGSWRLIANAAPYLYQVGEAGDGSTSSSWSQTSAGTQSAAELAPGATSLSVTVVGPLFTTAANLTLNPLSLIVGGEIMPVSAIAGGASPQTFTVTRTLPKRHAAGTPVRVYRPLIAAL